MTTYSGVSHKKIDAAMKARRLTPDDVAYGIRNRSRGEIRTTARNVVNWAKGVNEPRAAVIPFLAQTLDVDIADLYGEAPSADDEEEADPVSDLTNAIRRFVRAEVQAASA